MCLVRSVVGMEGGVYSSSNSNSSSMEVGLEWQVGLEKPGFWRGAWCVVCVHVVHAFAPFVHFISPVLVSVGSTMVVFFSSLLRSKINRIMYMVMLFAKGKSFFLSFFGGFLRFDS